MNRSGVNLTAMTIATNGAVTMGVSPLTVVSTAYTSDAKLKYEIEDLNNNDCLDIFNSINAKSFKWKANDKKSIGFVANEVESVLPTSGLFGDLVNESEYQPNENIEAVNIKTLDYSRMSVIFYGWS